MKYCVFLPAAGFKARSSLSVHGLILFITPKAIAEISRYPSARSAVLISLPPSRALSLFSALHLTSTLCSLYIMRGDCRISFGGLSYFLIGLYPSSVMLGFLSALRARARGTYLITPHRHRLFFRCGIVPPGVLTWQSLLARPCPIHRALTSRGLSTRSRLPFSYRPRRPHRCRHQ